MIMRSAISLIVAFAVTFVYADPSKFEEHRVVPDVIGEVPPGLVSVTYEGGQKVELGNILTPTQVKNRPTFSWGYEKGANYTLIFTDPDAGGHEFLHCLIVNIPENNLDAGHELFAYVGSGPPMGTGFHRYVYLVYKEPKETVFTEEPVPNTSAKGRSGFNTREWTSDHKLGKPIAGNFYRAEWDDYVPTLHQQLGFQKRKPTGNGDEI